MSGRRLRIAVIGTGFVGPHHVDAARRTGLADVDVIVGSDAGRTEARARQLAVDRWSTEPAAVLGDPGIDVVHLCTPNDTHVPLGVAALDAGRHLVVEKPVALDGAGAAELAAAADRAGRHAMVALTYRGYPMVRRARAMVEAGDLGTPRLVRGGYVQDWLAEETDYNWRLEPGVAGASRAVADIGTHWFDTAEFVSGLRVEAVLADLVTVLPRRLRPRAARQAFAAAAGPAEPFDVRSEDAATILLRFAGGARGTCVVSQVSPGYRNALALQVDGSARSLAWEQEVPERLWLGGRQDARLLVRDQGDEPPATGVPPLPAGHPEGWADALRDLLRPFYAAIAAGEPPPAAGASYPTLRDGARSIDFVEAVLASSASERWVALPPAGW